MSGEKQPERWTIHICEDHRVQDCAICGVFDVVAVVPEASLTAALERVSALENDVTTLRTWEQHGDPDGLRERVRELEGAIEEHRSSRQYGIESAVRDRRLYAALQPAPSTQPTPRTDNE